MIHREVLLAIEEGIICPVCNLGYIKLDKLYLNNGHYKKRIICSNCNEELQIVCETNPFKIVKINKIK